MENSNLHNGNASEDVDEIINSRPARAMKSQLEFAIRQQEGFRPIQKHGGFVIKEVYHYNPQYSELYWLLQNIFDSFYCIFRACHRQDRDIWVEYIGSGFPLDIQVSAENLANNDKAVSVREWELPKITMVP